MGRKKGCTAPGPAPMRREEKGSRCVENLMKYCLVMSFADRMLEREILSLEEYSAFSVDTAHAFTLKMPPNSFISPRLQGPKPPT